jgi:hypothetical protein
MTGPLILIVLGALLLLRNLYPDVYPFTRVWPVILIVIGIAKLVEGLVHRSRGGDEPPSGKELE